MDIGSPAPAPLDPKPLATLRDRLGDRAPVAVANLIDCYLAEAAEQLQTMQRAVADADADALKRAAHTLKSSSGSLGAATLANLCRHLENLGRMGILEANAPACQLLADALQEFERVEAALQREKA